MKRPLKKLASERLELPTKKTVPCAHLSDYIILIYGREKIGKTTLCAQFPNALFLMFEPGGKALSVYQTEVHSWVDFRQYIELLKEDTRFENIIIDTADLCYRFCLDYTIKRLLAGDHPSEVGYGKGWDVLYAEFQSAINALCKLGKGVIFLSHDAEKEIKLRTGGAYDIIAPTMQSVARNTLQPLVDVFAYYYYADDGERRLKIVGDKETMGGTRIKEAGFFAGIDEIPMGASPAEAYRNFVAAFEGKLKVQPPKPSVQRLPERKGKFRKKGK